MTKVSYPLNLECPKHVPNSLFCDWKHHLKPFRLVGAVKLWEDKGSLTDLANQLIARVLVKQPLASPESAKNIVSVTITLVSL